MGDGDGGMGDGDGGMGDGDDQRICLSLKFSIVGFFWLG